MEYPGAEPAIEAAPLWKRALPWLLALFFGVLSLASRNLQEISPSDPSRHLLNGALLYDMIRSGNVFHPMEFSREYYMHYPATSLPFHPPLFPLFEAALFSVFGVEPAVARVAVAITVAASALLLYALILELNASVTLAFLTTVTFLSLRICRDVASAVMLEFPALCLTLAALYCLRRFDRKFSLRTGILFALLGGAAAWTKQVALGLGAVPWLLTAFTNRWSYFRRRTIWISSVIFGVLALAVVEMPLMTLRWGGSAGKTRHTLPVLVAMRAAFYWQMLGRQFSAIGLVVLVAAVVLAGVRVFRRSEGWFADSFYLAWMMGILAVPLVTPQFDQRYILGSYPAMIALGYLAVFRAAGMIFPRQWAWCPVYAAALSICVISFTWWPKVYLLGVRPAAQFVAGERPARILYCGNQEGDFLAQLRATNPRTPPIVIRSDQVPYVRTPEAIDVFAHRLGIDHIVVERSVDRSSGNEWAGLPTAKMELEKEFPIVDRLRQWGELAVYRFTDPAPNPPDSLWIRSRLLGRGVRLDARDR